MRRCEFEWVFVFKFAPAAKGRLQMSITALCETNLVTRMQISPLGSSPFFQSAARHGAEATNAWWEASDGCCSDVGTYNSHIRLTVRHTALQFKDHRTREERPPEPVWNKPVCKFQSFFACSSLSLEAGQPASQHLSGKPMPDLSTSTQATT